jgi:hypothetical protein
MQIRQHMHHYSLHCLLLLVFDVWLGWLCLTDVPRVHHIAEGVEVATTPQCGIHYLFF